MSSLTRILLQIQILIRFIKIRILIKIYYEKVLYKIELDSVRIPYQPQIRKKCSMKMNNMHKHTIFACQIFSVLIEGKMMTYSCF